MKILVTRTAPFTVFKKALTKIRSVHPGAALYVLIQKSSRQSLASYGGGITPITISDGPFSLLENGPSLVNKIRAEKFDLAVVLYGNERGTGYLNVSLLTLLGDVPSEMIFDNLENFYVNRYRLFKILRKFVQSSFGHFLYSTILMVLKFSKFFHTCQTESMVWKKNEQKTADFPVFPQKKAKRIVMVDLMFTWPPHGGACVDLKEIATRLKSRGYDIRLVVPEYDGIFPRGSVDRELLSVETHKVPFSSKTFNRFFLPRRIGAKVEALSPDFVYLGDSYFLKPFLYRALQNHRVISRFYTYELLCPNYYLLYKNGKKCTLNYLDTPLDCVSCALEGMKKNIQSLDLEVWSHEFLMSLGFLPSYNQFVKDSFSFCETLITYNDLASSLLSPFHPDVKTFPGGVDTGNFFHVQRPIKRVKRILLTGRLMDPRKGLLFFIENIRKLRRERGDFDVVITYDQNFGEDYIKSLGWVNHSAIKSLYNDVDICVVPSLWEEPFGMVALEAMASGKPVVASAVSGLRMSVDDGVTGFLFPSGDGPKMIEALNTLLDSPELMTSMGAAGRKRAEKYFDWERVVDRYCDEVFERG